MSTLVNNDQIKCSVVYIVFNCCAFKNCKPRSDVTKGQGPATSDNYTNQALLLRSDFFCLPNTFQSLLLHQVRHRAKNGAFPENIPDFLFVCFFVLFICINNTLCVAVSP